MTSYTKEEVLLQAKYLNLAFDGKWILRNINFCIRDIVRPGIQQGQVVSLVGRSGIGKTQLFRILSGLQQPDSGTIEISRKPEIAEAGRGVGVGSDRSTGEAGVVVAGGMRAVQPGDMGVIFQNYYQFRWRTVHQSLRLAARQNKSLWGVEEDAIKHYIDRFDLPDVLHLYPQQLSGGQQQRVSIIQQLLKGSDFLLLDEPFSGLDVCVLDKVVELLLQVSLSDERKTLIIVSHDIATAVAISDTVFILAKEDAQAGSTIVKEIDLIERGLAWEKNVREQKAFADTIGEIKACL